MFKKIEILFYCSIHYFILYYTCIMNSKLIRDETLSFGPICDDNTHFLDLYLKVPQEDEKYLVVYFSFERLYRILQILNLTLLRTKFIDFRKLSRIEQMMCLSFNPQDLIESFISSLHRPLFNRFLPAPTREEFDLCVRFLELNKHTICKELKREKKTLFTFF